MMENLQLDFFNTIKLNQEELEKATDTALKQEDKILSVMNTNVPYTPFEIQNIYVSRYENVPITSIRRAMTVLTKKNKLIKLSDFKLEQYGKPNHRWVKVANY